MIITHPDKREEQDFNDYAWFLKTERGLYKAKEAVCQPLLIQRLSLSWFFLSFPGVNKHANNEKKWPQNTEYCSNRNRKFFKKIACQTDGDNGFPEIANNFSDELSACVVNDCLHWLNDNIMEERCQGAFSRFFVLTIP